MEKHIDISDRLFEILTSGSDEKKLEDIRRIVGDDVNLENLVRQIEDKEYVSRQIDKMNSYDTDAGWDAVAGRTGISRRSILRLSFKWGSVAATVAAIAVMFVIWFTRQGEVMESDSLITPALAMVIEESEQKGITGAKSEDVIIERASVQNSRRDKQSVLPESTDKSRKSFSDKIKEAKRVTTFYDKEFWLNLPDGSVVHLARDTRILYPEMFASDCREVYLSGEAYFIVANNPRKRFIIHTESGSITVYGTELNVDTRAVGECKVVLVTGKAGVTAGGGSELMLVPGEEAVISENEISVREVDLVPYQAWNTGRVDFDRWPLQRVLQVIGRWYGKEIVFKDDSPKAIEISGNFDRYEDLMPTLESIAAITGLSVSVSGGSIVISECHIPDNQ